jgi:hypothetical protein
MGPCSSTCVDGVFVCMCVWGVGGGEVFHMARATALGRKAGLSQVSSNEFLKASVATCPPAPGASWSTNVCPREVVPFDVASKVKDFLTHRGRDTRNGLVPIGRSRIGGTWKQ